MPSETATVASGSPSRKFVDLFENLRKTRDVPERLELQGLATRGGGGELVLRDDVREPFEALEARLNASAAAGRSPREAAEAERLDVDHGKTTHAIYAIFKKGEGGELYIGESGQVVAVRFKRHPDRCPKLASAFDGSDGGKDDWECVVLFVLPEDARSKELLLYLESRLQRLLDTVDGQGGLNCHHGAGGFGGEPDEDAWLERYVELIEFVEKRGKTPSQKSKDRAVRSLGRWANHQRERRDEMSTHRRKALEAIGCAWRWRINASPIPNAFFFEKLRADHRVKESGGVHIPMDIEGVCWQRVRSARRHYKNGEMPEHDREIVDAEFPGLKMTAQDASFLLSAKAFAEKYPRVETLPSTVNDKAMYNWLKGMQTGHIAITIERKEVLESFGLSTLMETLKPPEVRSATVALRNARNSEYNAADSAARAERREAKRRKMIDDIVEGPQITFV